MDQNSLFRSRDWLSVNQGPVFPDLVDSCLEFYLFFQLFFPREEGTKMCRIITLVGVEHKGRSFPSPSYELKTVQDCKNCSYGLHQSIKFDYGTHTFAQIGLVTRIPLRTIESYMLQLKSCTMAIFGNPSTRQTVELWGNVTLGNVVTPSPMNYCNDLILTLTLRPAQMNTLPALCVNK
eukprot:sb/3471726/